MTVDDVEPRPVKFYVMGPDAEREMFRREITLEAPYRVHPSIPPRTVYDIFDGDPDEYMKQLDGWTEGIPPYDEINAPPTDEELDTLPDHIRFVLIHRHGLRGESKKTLRALAEMVGRSATVVRKRVDQGHWLIHQSRVPKWRRDHNLSQDYPFLPIPRETVE